MTGVELLDRVEDLLRRQTELLRAGDLPALSEICDETARLADSAADMARDPALRAQVARIRARAEANMPLIRAAIRGVRAVGQRMEMLRRATDRLDTYDRLGRALRIEAPCTDVERRA
jgi:hypothetical protein